VALTPAVKLMFVKSLELLHSLMALPSYLKTQGDLTLLYLKIQPRASKSEICDVIGDELKIRIAAPPVESAANEALIRFLAEVLRCPRSALQLVRGAASRHKVVAVRGLPITEIYLRLTDGKGF
jgi:uncharacterized protein